MSSKFAGLALEVEKPSRMIIMHPVTQQPLRDKDGKEAYIDLYSTDSVAARSHEQNVLRRRINMRRGAKMTPEELEADSVEMLTALTVGWYLLDLTGEAMGIEFSQENAREAYGLPGWFWLREQINTFVGDRGNFSKASSSS